MSSYAFGAGVSALCACAGSVFEFRPFATAIAVGYLGLSLSASAAPIDGKPFTPADDGQILERLPSTPQSGSSGLRQLSAQLRRRPGDLQLATDLARRYIELGRRQADPRYDGYAQAALQQWWDQLQAPTEVLVLRAILLQRRHNFDAALADLDRVLTRSPDHPQALLTRASLQEVQGNYAAAMEDCLRLAHAATYAVAATCQASVSARTGHGPKAFEVVKQLASKADSAWMQTVLADIAVQLGRDDAVSYVEQALGSSPDDPYLLALHADLLLQQGRFEDVRDLLEEHTEIDALLLRLALAEKKLNGGQRNAGHLQQHADELARRFDAGRRRGDTIHLREEAIFQLHVMDRDEAALELARKNWRKQREPADAVILLEAALATLSANPDHTAAVESTKSLLVWLEEKGLEHAWIAPLEESARRRMQVEMVSR